MDRQCEPYVLMAVGRSHFPLLLLDHRIGSIIGVKECRQIMVYRARPEVSLHWLARLGQPCRFLQCRPACEHPIMIQLQMR